MDTTSGHNPSIWTATADLPAMVPLAADTDTDVCVVGAGIAGLTTAYLLAREGKSVIVIDDGGIASGESSRTTAQLVSALDDGYEHLERLFGNDGARLAVASHAAAIDRIESIIRDESIDCDFTRLDGYLFLPPPSHPEHDPEKFNREFEAAGRLGVNPQRADRAPITTFDTGPAIRFPNQGRFHPLRYLAALARAITGRGGRIHTDTHADEIHDGGGDTPPRVHTSSGHTITARAVVVATNTPVNDLVSMHTKQAPYRSYVIAARIPRGSVSDALYWDMLESYHYIRLQPLRDEEFPREGGLGGEGGLAGERAVRDTHAGHDLLIVGGEDHKTGQADDFAERFDRLAAWARDRFPTIEGIDFRWSGQIMEPVDSLAFIGKNPMGRNVYIATGDSGHGMTHGTIAGILLTDLIMGRDNPWESLYAPNRRSLRTAGGWIKENVNAAAQYTDYLTPGEVDSTDDIRPGHGAILRRGLTKLACYKDESGGVHTCSAVCTHLGGLVRWNDAEKSWDCPVHGSRFDPEGNVLNGPAITNLSHPKDPPHSDHSDHTPGRAEEHRATNPERQRVGTSTNPERQRPGAPRPEAGASEPRP